MSYGFIRYLFLMSLLIFTSGCSTESSNNPLNDGANELTLSASIQEAFGADSSLYDTDGDGLSDDFEIIYGYPEMSPDNADSDGNGTNDSLEDNDEDGLSNLEEQEKGTNPLNSDSDSDGLTDSDEVSVHLSNPTLKDTDGDNIVDGREIELGTNPLVADSDQQIKSTQTLSITDALTGNESYVQVSIVGKGDLANDILISANDTYKSVGQVGKTYDITLKNTDTTLDFVTAEITLPYNASDSEAADPTQLSLFTIDPTSGFWEELPSITDTETLTVTATTTHFSPFFIANKNTFTDYLNDLPESCRAIDDPNALSANVILVIDSSGSMSSNDPSNLRISAAQEFINAMKPTDQVGIVSFSTSARTLSELTGDSADLNLALQRVSSSGGTNIGRGVSSAISLLESGAVGSTSAIILLSDGDGNYSDSLTTTMKEQGIRAFTIGLGSDANEELLKDIAEKTQGGYKQIQDASSLVGIFGEFSTVFGDDGTDTDDDGLTDCQEVQGVYVSSLKRIIQTLPSNPDSDGDGILDGSEVGMPTKTVTAYVGTPFVSIGLSDPNNADSDGDLLLDIDEYRLSTSPIEADTDGDGLSDYAELVLYDSDPFSQDTDGDDLSDLEEVNRADEGFDPAVHDYKTTPENKALYYAGFAKGAAVDDNAEVGTFPEFTGLMLGSLIAITPDARDAIANGVKGDYFSAAESVVGLQPVSGDADTLALKAVNFINTFPRQRSSVVKLLEVLPAGEEIKAELPPIDGQSGAWLETLPKRGELLEEKMASLVDGKALLGSYPQFDVWDEATGTATSLKTIDLNAKAYQRVAGLESAVKWQLKQLNKDLDNPLTGKATDGVRTDIAKDAIVSRELVIGIPKALDAEQELLIQELLTKSGGVINIIVID